MTEVTGTLSIEGSPLVWGFLLCAVVGFFTVCGWLGGFVAHVTYCFMARRWYWSWSDAEAAATRRVIQRSSRP